jgi:hypothetical protein
MDESQRVLTLYRVVLSTGSEKMLELAIHKSRGKKLKRYMSSLHPTWIEKKPTLG